MPDDPVRRRVEQLAREKHIQATIVDQDGDVYVCEVGSASCPDLVYTVLVTGNQILKHSPECKGHEMRGTCSHAAAAWLKVHEHLASRAADAAASTASPRLVDQYIQPSLWPTVLPKGNR